MIGTLISNRYKIIEKIAEGGMGVVYKAKCTLLNRFVAIKILKSELCDNKDFINRFKREANSIASLSHQNIVNIYDVGIDNDINYIVMEYIKGKTLKQIVIENGKLNLQKTLDITLQISRALEYAHNNTIIHRDIKPDNILITEDNIVKLMDFGIAKVGNSITITGSHNIIGSVHYFSPEQAKGKLVDARTDIYALGVVMYEMITGQVPFNGDSPISIAIMHIDKSVIPPKEIADNIPENINAVILKALEKEPVNRFQTAKELSDIISKIKEDNNFKVNFNNKSLDSTTILMAETNKDLSHMIYNSTVIMSERIIPKTMILDNDKRISSNSTVKRKNKKIPLAIGIIILFTICGMLGGFLYKQSTFKDTTTASNTLNNEKDSTNNTDDKSITKEDDKAELPQEKKISVPSLIGKTQDTAENIINSNGFLPGAITAEYNDNIPKGLIIRQSPVAGTYCDKSQKIDLVISQGEQPAQVAPQHKQNGNGKDKEKKIKSK
ncbi:Stk1 family PASTA domain-containing Ser/Thr kinase [Clostridium sp. BL-8]|uniref:Stk1 family PASTA domain-containing Ser/Thr kinase n=1 Tax=Clostridium sp. BL-8 TaxID=349938 RepID=UPI00098BD817|nr:Stk1 family PASTA domain-containing Ser/Thr kinase [Clostridium sp. BL-8]OOM78708.1 serine/threonine-protein kinase PrkC [Clostridium sp. BL-8]